MPSQLESMVAIDRLGRIIYGMTLGLHGQRKSGILWNSHSLSKSKSSSEIYSKESNHDIIKEDKKKKKVLIVNNHTHTHKEEKKTHSCFWSQYRAP